MNPVSLPLFSRLRRRLLFGAAVTGWLLVGVCHNAAAYLINEWEPLGPGGTTPKGTQNIQPGKHWRDPVSDARMVWITGGCFSMGSPPRASGRETDEGPMQQCVADFWLGETEITQGQWRRVMHNNPARFRKGDAYPVESVSREDVEEFLTAINEKNHTNVQFRLPTETEWEFACRQGGQRVVFSGGGEPGRLAWHATNSLGSTHEVGSRTPNRLGLKDMSGNVWEWLQERYHATRAQQQEGDQEKSARNRFYTIRGGGWKDQAPALRCANRGFESLITRRNDLGLRLAASIRGKDKKSKHRQIDIQQMPF